MAKGNTSFPIDVAQLVGLFIESVFYGCVSTCFLFLSYKGSLDPIVILLFLSVLVLIPSSLAGIFLESFFSCLKALLWSEGTIKPFRQLNITILIASLTMFTIASLDVGFHLRHNLEAFVWYNGPAVERFNKTSSWINVANTGCHVAQTLIGDFILVRKELSTREKLLASSVRYFKLGSSTITIGLLSSFQFYSGSEP
jgi:hypothetical protein